ncbi:MAG: hypothetical protein IT223_03010 [Crocinitomicaceae bacterium]|nr:hypothetical protein [Crocinitomicaceae bacterium]
MKRVEILLIVATLAGSLLYIINAKGGAEILMISGLLLSMLYFLPGFFLHHDLSLKEALSNKKEIKKRSVVFTAAFAGISLSVLTLAFVYGIMLWAGGFFFGMMGLLLTVVCFFLALFVLRSEINLRKKILLRLFLFFMITATLFFSPTKVKIELLVHDAREKELRLRIDEDPYDIRAREELEYYLELKKGGE